MRGGQWRHHSFEGPRPRHYPHAPSAGRSWGRLIQGIRLVNEVISPVILYLLLALGGVGVCLALPRRGGGPAVVGGLLAAAAGGLIVLVMSVRAKGQTPNLYFYVFSVIALGGAVRVISHP